MIKFENVTEKLNGMGELVDQRARTYLFLPTDGKDMRSEYPELGDISEFTLLNNAELVFVWCLGNRTSPLSNELDPKVKYRKALEWSKLDKKLDLQTNSDYLLGKFPNKISSAISRMAMFVPSIRMRAKLMSEKMLVNLERMVDVSEEEFKVMDIDEKKKFAGFAKDVTNVLDELVVSLENAYGIKDIKRKKGDTAKSAQPTLMDKVMSR